MVEPADAHSVTAALQVRRFGRQRRSCLPAPGPAPHRLRTLAVGHVLTAIHLHIKFSFKCACWWRQWYRQKMWNRTEISVSSNDDQWWFVSATPRTFWWWAAPTVAGWRLKRACTTPRPLFAAHRHACHPIPALPAGGSAQLQTAVCVSTPGGVVPVWRNAGGVCVCGMASELFDDRAGG